MQLNKMNLIPFLRIQRFKILMHYFQLFISKIRKRYKIV